MKSRKQYNQSLGKGSKKSPNGRDETRHSSPVLGSVQLPSKDSSANVQRERPVKLNVNRSSNSSDISVPGHSLHTDSGISSFDSLAGGEKRCTSPVENDFVSDLLKMADGKLTELAVRDDESWGDENDLLYQSKQMIPPLSSTRTNIVLPVLGNVDMATSTSSIFMTAMDTEVAIPENCSNDYDLSVNNERYDKSLPSVTSYGIDNDSRLYCSACGNILNDPRLLPCLHTFCTQCLQSNVTHIETEDIILSGNECSFSSERLICPTCSSTTDLSLEGVHSLPVNHMIQRLLELHNLRSSKVHEINCDLCPESSNIEARCIQCCANMCQFCLQAHKRQSLTSAHTVILTNEVDADGYRHNFSTYKSRKSNIPLMCQRHTSEELKLYCLDCSQLVCRDCCLGSKHRDHKCEYLNHVIEEKVSQITNEFKACELKIHSLVRAISMLEQSAKTVEDTAEEVAGKVERHIASYIISLEKHKSALLASIQQKTKLKRQSVLTQKENLSKMLKDLSHSCEVTADLLNSGTNHEILSMKPFVLQRLQTLSKISFSESPRSLENFIEFRANKKVKTWINGDMVSCLAENKRSSKLLRPGLEVDICGDVVSRALEPKNCTAHGEGIHCSRVKLPSEFVVIAKNNESEKLEMGGHDLSVSIAIDGIDQKLLKKPKVQVTDRQDGTYRVLYIVYATGKYNLDVRIFGEHICGSPFHVTAMDSVSHVHSGIFHCCCFCSSGGDKNSKCACGATMPGGYQGCGHGHEGHPGSAHWSCCGKTTEASSCSKPGAPGHSFNNGAIHLQHGVDRQSHTLPTRRINRDFIRQASGGDDMYASSSVLRSQRGPPYPGQYFSKQPNASTPSSKQIKTVTL